MRILIVEDDESIRRTLEHVFSSEGYAVTSASDGQAALDLLPLIPLPDAVVTDLSMHPMDGRSFIANLKRNSVWRDIPIVVISAEIVNDVAGSNAVLRKPFCTEDLLSTVGMLINH